MIGYWYKCNIDIITLWSSYNYSDLRDICLFAKQTMANKIS